ncbi:UNKNOWN [Stylonychia lemnae]|uniref:Tetraspanin family protein n=1 Tax=Stylonychia lemnae TaxID=5949 RepID=A0A078B0B0_STYLE|nr:UNKNOWN [Stylonychia lemnae]|eukprot:CDW86528.1 UNKNOWN [Stylonychia lemnae]
MPKTSASVFQVVAKDQLKNLETNFWVSPVMARNSVYACCIFYFFHEGFRGTSINEIIFTPLLIYSLFILAAAMVSVCTVNSYHKNESVIAFYTLNILLLLISLIAFYVLNSGSSYFQMIVQGDCVIKESEMFIKNQYHKQDKKLLCSEQCPCKIDNQELSQKLENDKNIITDKINGFINLQGCLNASSDRDRLFNANQVRYLEETFQCSGICELGDLYLYSDISRGIPQRSCNKALIDFLKRITEISKLQCLFIGIICVINSISIWILHSRYILLVSDEDLFGKDSDGEGEFDDNASLRSGMTSTFDKSYIDQKSYEAPKLLNLDSNKRLQQRRNFNNLRSTNTSNNLPLPSIVEKKESEFLDTLIADIKNLQVQPNNAFDSITPKFGQQSQK